MGLTTIFEDNEICIRMPETKSSTPRMQYLDARYHWLREAVVHSETIRMVHCSTTEMVADVLTKPLGSYKSTRFHGSMSCTAPIPRPSFAGDYGRIAISLHNPDSMPLLSDVWRIRYPGGCFLHTISYERSQRGSDRSCIHTHWPPCSLLTAGQRHSVAH
jgi:hypothetical protein